MITSPLFPTRKEALGTSLRGYLFAKYSDIVGVFGEPNHPPTSDGKIRFYWILTDGEIQMTVYDYKESRPVHEVQQWHIGGKTDTALLLIEQYFPRVVTKWDKVKGE